MKKAGKIALYTYRVLLALAILAAGGELLACILFFLLKPLVLLYPPYSAWAVIALFFVVGIWVTVAGIRSQRKHRKEQEERAKIKRPDFKSELIEIVETCLSKYPYEVSRDESDFTLFMPDHNRSIHFDIGPSGIDMQIFVGGWDEDGYYANSPEELKELVEKFSSDLDDWLNDRIVQVCFITDEARFPYSFACSSADMDEVISKQLEGYSADFWWMRILRFIFLFPPPKPVLEIQVTSANGVYDRTIPCNEIRSRVI